MTGIVRAHVSLENSQVDQVHSAGTNWSQSGCTSFLVYPLSGAYNQLYQEVHDTPCKTMNLCI